MQVASAATGIVLNDEPRMDRNAVVCSALVVSVMRVGLLAISSLSILTATPGRYAPIAFSAVLLSCSFDCWSDDRHSSKSAPSVAFCNRVRRLAAPEQSTAAPV